MATNQAKEAFSVGPKALSLSGAGHALGIGRTSIWKLIAGGDLKSFKIGKRRLIAVSEIERFIASRQAD
ncbi:MAG TPA: helix-turn-helix domain-containing protein [Candidatus Defluviicoccus seviourii]|nr:helix-turn-helix domain-containing protein [Candidatus Defluviicoccus seviourii]